MDLKIGDEVRITPPGQRHKNDTPEGGYVGRVTKTGRKYATAEYEITYADYKGEQRSIIKTVEFSMETGIERNSSSNFTARVQTPEQAERQIRQGNARKALFRAGISVSGLDSRFTLEQWEALAKVAATLPEYDRSSL